MGLWDDEVVGSCGSGYSSTRFRGHNFINSPFKILRCFHRIPRDWVYGINELWDFTGIS